MNERSVGYLIKNINDKMKVKADSDLKSRNLTLSQSRVLAYLNNCGGTATQKDIELFLEVSHPTVVGIVARMRQNGYVTSSFDLKEGKSTIVSLTEKAFEIGKDMEEKIRADEAKMLESLSDKQISEFKNALIVVYKNLSKK